MRKFYPIVCLLFIFLIRSTPALAQCVNTINAGDDLLLCAPAVPVQLDATIGGPYVNFSWSPAALLSNANTLTPTATVNATTTFVLTSQLLGDNLVVNGDFEQGNTGFTNSYVYSPGNLTASGTYDVWSNPYDLNDLYASCEDHTPGGTQMLIINSNLDISSVWDQTVSVTPNTKYRFEVWATSVRTAIPLSGTLRLGINGTLLPIGVSLPICGWTKIFTTWDSGTNTTAALSVSTPKGGWDTAYDDIYFGTLCTFTDDVKLTVKNVTASAVPVAYLPCNGNPIALNATASSTGPEFTYNWETQDGHLVSGQQSLQPQVDALGTYTLTVDAPNGIGNCTKTTEVQVVTAPMSAFISPPALLNCTVTSTFLQGQSSAPATSVYEWTASAGGHILSAPNLPTIQVDHAGEYHLLVTNTATGCTAEASVIVSANTTPPVVVADIDSFDCVQQRIFLFGTVSSPGALHAWSTPNGHIVSGADSLVALVDTSGTYILTATNPANHCTAADTVLIATDTLVPWAGIQSPGVFNCGTDSLLLTASINPANAALAWSAAAGGQIRGRTDTTLAVAIAPGVYSLTVTSPFSGCTAVATDTVQQDVAPPVALIQPAGTLTCQQPALALSADSSSTGPHITYAWTAAAGGNIVSGADSTAPVVNAPGWYYLLVTDTTNNCTAVDSVAVQADTTAVIALANAPQALNCVVTQVALDANGSSTDSMLIYLWTTTDGHIVSGANSPAPLVDAPGTYRLFLSNPANGCTATDVADVTQNTAAPQINILPPNVLSCALPVVTIPAQAGNPAGIFHYSWSAANGGHIVSGDSTLTPSVDAAGAYTLLATDLENGCTAAASTDVVSDFVAPGAAIAVSGALNCNNSNVLLTSTSTADPALLDHAWTLPDGSVAGTGTDPVFGATLAGGYLLVVSNRKNGCTSTATATVFARDPVKSGIIDLQNVPCFGDRSGNAGATASGGAGFFTYLWSNNATTPAIGNLAAGTYTVTVSDGDHCTATAEATINQPEQLIATTSSTPPSVTGAADGTATVQAAGGTPGYTYLWSTGATEPMIFGLTAGFYTVTVTDSAASGCTAVRSVAVGEAACNLAVAVSSINPGCPGAANGQAALAVSNGAAPFTYLWSSGGTGQTETGLAAGTYTYTVTDAAGCDLSGAVELTEPGALVVAVENVLNTSCANAAEGVATAAANGGTGVISYSWSNGQTGLVANNLVAGAYTVTATDANGCTALATAAVLSLDAEAPVITATDTTVALGPSGLAELNLLTLGVLITDNCALSGFSLDPATFDCSQLGSHPVTITAVDSAGNSSAATITVTVIDQLAPVINCPANLVRCSGEPVVEYLLPVAADNCLGGQFDLVAGLPSGSSFPEGTTTNTYTFTDAGGNAAACSFDVTILSPLTVTLDTILPDLGNQKIGGVQVTVGGSQPGYTYAWTLGGQTVATTEDLAGVGLGVYTLVVTDAAGCTATAGPFEVTNVTGANAPAWTDRVGVFPNPTAGALFVLLPDDLADRDVQVSVLDLTGRRVLDRQFSGQRQLTVDLSALAEGLYTVSVRVEGQTGVWKVVRVRN